MTPSDFCVENPKYKTSAKIKNTANEDKNTRLFLELNFSALYHFSLARFF